jgi:molybdopterin-guanine dinucleotide biosynthesis protein A
MIPAVIIPAVILAGGRSQRLGGGDKCLLALDERSILAHVIAALLPQAGEMLINSNSAPALFDAVGLPVRADVLPGRLGPLAGIHTAMVWARERGAKEVLTVPADTPFLPGDLVARLSAACEAGEAAIAASQGELHPVIGLWPCALAERLEDHLAKEVYRVRAWLGRIDYAVVDFEGEVDPFWNINTPDDLQLARRAVLAR